MVSVISEHIEITKGVCGGKPRIAGHRIKVQDVVILHEEVKLSPSEIISQYPMLTLADVYAALTYYYDHQEEITKNIREDDLLEAEMKNLIPSKLPREEK